MYISINSRVAIVIFYSRLHAWSSLMYTSGIELKRPREHKINSSSHLEFSHCDLVNIPDKVLSFSKCLTSSYALYVNLWLSMKSRVLPSSLMSHSI